MSHYELYKYQINIYICKGYTNQVANINSHFDMVQKRKNIIQQKW